MTKTMTLAVDVAAYCEVDLPDDTVMTKSNLKAIASEVFSDYTYKGVNYSFAPDWSTEGALRIVSAKQGDDVVAEGVPVEPCYHDTGTEFVSWLNGSQSLEQAIEASEAMLNERDRSVIEVYRGAFKLPGAEAIEVNFECRKGATREEKDLAFFSALADLGTVDYLCIGAVKRDYVVCVGGTPGEGWLTQPSDVSKTLKRSSSQPIPTWWLDLLPGSWPASVLMPWQPHIQAGSSGLRLWTAERLLTFDQKRI